MSKLVPLPTNCIPQSPYSSVKSHLLSPSNHGTQTLRGTRMPACSLYLKVALVSGQVPVSLLEVQLPLNGPELVNW